MEAITVEEWNDLSSKEQDERCKSFISTLKSGHPSGLDDLRHLALVCKTPIPSIDEFLNIDFNGFNF